MESAYTSLYAEAQTVLAKLSAREIQAEELSSLNSTLASHTNPHQKILYVEKIRRQLDDVRVRCHVLESERDQLRAQCSSLQSQVDVYVQVNGQASVSHAISPTQASETSPGQPLQGLGLQLDGLSEVDRERLAARAAWQQRPRTKTVRVLREQRSSPRLRQHAAEEHPKVEEPDTKAKLDHHQSSQISKASTPPFTHPHRTPRRIASSSALQPRDMNTQQASASPASTSSLLSPARAEGFFERWITSPARLVKSVGSSPPILSTSLSDTPPPPDDLSPHLGTQAIRPPPSPLREASSFAMPLDDGDLTFEDLTTGSSSK